MLTIYDLGKRRPYTYKEIVEIDYPEIWDLAQSCLQITKAWQEMTVDLMPLFKKRSTLLNYLKVRSLYSFASYIAEQVNHLCHQLAFCANEQDQEGVDHAKIALVDLFDAFGKLDAFDIALDNIDGFLKLEQDVEGFGERTDLGRWEDYINSCHGGNKLLKKLNENHIKDYFYFTILETYNQNTPDQFIIERESHWKDVLRTRQFGYNDN